MMRVNVDGEPETFGVAREAGRQHVDHRRREGERQGQQEKLAHQEQRENVVGEMRGARRPALLANAGIGRHEGGVESAFRENGAEMVRQAQRHEKGVGHRPGAQYRGQDNVADEAGEPREQREAADCENALDHRFPAGDGTMATCLRFGPTQR